MFKGKLLLTKQSIFFLILLIILLIPNFFVLSYFQDIKGNTSMSLGYILLSSLVLSFPLIFIKKKTYFSIGLIFLILSPLEIIFVKLLGIPITVGFMSSVFSTNFNEAKEQFISNSALIIAIASIGIFYIFILNKIENNYLSKRIRIIILLVFSIFNLLLFFQMYNIQKGEQLTKTKKLKN
jgi:glucan phosphoethanolaminetransferase (alkaline phosphatase superfamily)